jgi:hypothetical protein
MKRFLTSLTDFQIIITSDVGCGSYLEVALVVFGIGFSAYVCDYGKSIAVMAGGRYFGLRS